MREVSKRKKSDKFDKVKLKITGKKENLSKVKLDSSVEVWKIR
jgi:hypothetical protein